MNVECAREQDVLDALAAQRWPSRCDDELRQHVGGCAICADLVEVASALLAEHDRAYDAARIPPSGLVWWRAQLRAREEDARAAARPIAFIQGIAVTVALWLTVSLVRAIPSATLAAWKAWLLASVPHVTVPTFAEIAAAVPLSPLVGLGAALLLIVLAIHFAFAE